MMDISIFRKYDIRGLVAPPTPQITPEIARLVGQALGTYLPQHFNTERFFVGCDNRDSSIGLKAAMIEGLISTGVDVTDIGRVMTPTTYFATASYANGDPRGAGVMITGSHLDTRYNGIKMAYGKLALAGEQIQDLLHIIQSGTFATGQGTVTEDFDMIHKHMDALSRMVKFNRKLKVVVDAGNGLSGSYVPALLEKLGLEVVCLYCESDGTYPNHLPNPEDPEMVVDLQNKVLEVGADLGLAFDGDADRCGFVDERAHHIHADRLLALLARDLLKRMPGSPIVFDVKSSQALSDFIKQHGGQPVMWKSGHSLMKQKMNELNAPLGGEVSGHIFIGENYYGFDDAPLVALKALEIFASSDKTVSEQFEDVPHLVATPEIILTTPDNVKFGIIDEIRDALSSDYEVSTIDGARAQFENGWGLVRASNTQPAITLRFEAYTNEQLVEYMKRFKALLNHHDEIDQSKFDAVMEQFKQGGY